MDTNREIELKLALEAADADRVFEHPLLRADADAPIEVRNLHSVYFDTRDRALAGAGVGLRLRRDGDRQWQTVKLGGDEAAGLFVRTEVEHPLAGERPDLQALPDPALRDRLIELVGERPLEPVFETTFERRIRRVRDEAGEWSLCRDRGEIRAGFARAPIGEIELELHRGPASHLYDVALQLADELPLRLAMQSKAERGERLRSGAPAAALRAEPVELSRDANLAQAVARIGRGCLRQIGVNAELVAGSEDPEAVHQLRVGLRRMRALLALVRRAAPSPRLGRLQASLRGLAGQLGEVRDLDVFLEQRLEPLRQRRPGDLALETLREEALALRAERQEAVRSALRSGRPTRWLLELGRWIAVLEETAAAGPPAAGVEGGTQAEPEALAATRAPLATGAEVFARAALTRLERKAKKRAEPALAGSASARHALRIALKKLRYASEFFRGFSGRKTSKRYLRRLGKLLDLLGEQNDLETTHRLIPVLLERCPPERAVELARAAGLVEGHALGEQERSQEELAWRWQRFEALRGFWLPD